MLLAVDYDPLIPPAAVCFDESTVRPAPSLAHTSHEKSSSHERNSGPTSAALVVASETSDAPDTYETQHNGGTTTTPLASETMTASTSAPPAEGATASLEDNTSGPRLYLIAIIVLGILATVILILCNAFFLGPSICGRRRRKKEGEYSSPESRLPTTLEEYQRSNREPPPGRRFPTIEEEKLEWALRRVGGEMA